MARKASPRHYASRGGYCCWQGKQLRILAKGPKDEPDGPTYRAACEEFRRVQGEPIFGPTLGSLIDSYLAWHRGQYLDSTHKSARAILVIVKAGVGSQYASQLTASRIEEWCNAQRKSRGWNNNTTNYAMRYIRACLRWAVDERQLRALPFTRLHLPPQTSRGVKCVLSPEQEGRVIRSASPAEHDVLVILRDTGCRPGEAVKIEAKHYVPEIRGIVFRSFDGDKAGHKTAKRTRKDRVIYLAPESQAIVERLIAQRPIGPILLDRPAPRGRHKGNRERPWSVRRLDDRLARLRTLANVPDLVPYSFRHTFAVRRLREGMSADVVAALLGTSRTMIEMHYGHLAEQRDFLRNAVDAINKASPPSGPDAQDLRGG